MKMATYRMTLKVTILKEKMLEVMILKVMKKRVSMKQGILSAHKLVRAIHLERGRMMILNLNSMSSSI
jgi:hypothetical protein